MDVKQHDDKFDGALTGSDYYHLFQSEGLGKKVWDEMCMNFYDIQSYDPDSTHATSFNEGRRSVIMELMYKMQQANNEYEDV